MYKMIGGPSRAGFWGCELQTNKHRDPPPDSIGSPCPPEAYSAKHQPSWQMNQVMVMSASEAVVSPYGKIVVLSSRCSTPKDSLGVQPSNRLACRVSGPRQAQPTILDMALTRRRSNLRGSYRRFSGILRRQFLHETLLPRTPPGMLHVQAF